MTYRNMGCLPHIDLDTEQQHQFQPVNYIFRNNLGDIPNGGRQAAVPLSINFRNGLGGFHNYYSTPINEEIGSLQNGHPFSNLSSDSGMPYGFYPPHMSASSSQYASFGSGNFVAWPENFQVNSTTIDENAAQSLRDPVKQKDAEVGAENSHFDDSFARLSTRTGTSREQNVPSRAASFNQSELYRNSSMLAMEMPSRTGASGFSSTIYPELGLGRHPYAPSQIGQRLHLLNNAWEALNGSDATDGTSQWNINTMTDINGRLLSSGSRDVANGRLQEIEGSSSNLTSEPLHYLHQCRLQSMQAHSLVDHNPMPAPYLQAINTNISLGPSSSIRCLPMGPRFPSFLFNFDHVAVAGPSHRAMLPYPDVSHGATGTQPSQSSLANQRFAYVELSGLDEEDEMVDEHIDMRLDIDDMSYEELLALEDYIGNVSTGLTEEFIRDNLKTSVYTPEACASFAEKHSTSLENDTCIICQVEYESNERVGTLDCGHQYHAGCIEQWLALKNWCPVCKTLALSTVAR